jgi:hypothetical protein
MSQKKKKIIIVLSIAISVISILIIFIYSEIQNLRSPLNQEKLTVDKINNIIKTIKKKQLNKLNKNTISKINTLNNKRIPASSGPRGPASQGQVTVVEHVILMEQKYKRFPGYNRPIFDKKMDPINKVHKTDFRYHRGKHKDSLQLKVWTDKPYYEIGNDVKLLAILSGKKKIINAPLSIQFEFPNRKLTKKYQFNSNNKMYYFNMNDYIRNIKPGLYKAYINYKDPNSNKDKDIYASVAFIISDTGAKLTGKYKIQKVDGSLIIQAQVEVHEKNANGESFYLQASLYDKNDLPILSTQNKVFLKSGKQWVELKFYGTLIYDHKVDGPYILKKVNLAKVDVPLIFGAPSNPNLKTKAYKYTEFTSLNYKE